MWRYCTREIEWPKYSWKRRTKLEDSCILTSKHKSKLQNSRSVLSYRTMGQKWPSSNKSIPLWSMGFLKECKVIWMRKSGFLNKCCWIFTCKIIKLDPFLTSFTKINSKWITELNVGAKTLKSQKKTVVSICDWLRQRLLRYGTQKHSKRKNRKIGFHQNLKKPNFKNAERIWIYFFKEDTQTAKKYTKYAQQN